MDLMLLTMLEWRLVAACMYCVQLQEKSEHSLPR